MRLHSLADACERGVEWSKDRPALHFVAFRDHGQFARAARLFGAPDFVHRVWDVRAARGGEIAHGDTVIFALSTEDEQPSPYPTTIAPMPDRPPPTDNFACSRQLPVVMCSYVQRSH